MNQLPQIEDHQNVRTYFSSFIDLNLSSFSHRKFAAQIGWPASLLGDIAAGRRGLAVARAIEFARFHAMTGVETERLVMLAIRDIDSAAVQKHVTDYLEKEATPWPRAEREEEFVSEMMTDQVLASLHLFLVWCQGQTTAEEIGRLLKTAPGLRDPVVLNEHLQTLRNLGVIEGELPNIKILKEDLAAKGMTRAQVFRSLLALRPTAESSTPGIQWQVSRVVFPRALYPELSQRLWALWNWIENTCDQNRGINDLEKTDKILLQVNTLVTQLLDLKEAGLEFKPDFQKGHAIAKLDEAARRTPLSH